jgi:PAS domain-containing protein/DNA-binding CsgD family transcriptional regulator
MQNTVNLKNYGDVVGKQIEDIEMPAEVKAKWVAQDIKVLGGEILHEEYVREVEGEKRAYENFTAPVIVDEGVIGMVGVAIDVTARKRVEDALRESEKRLADIIDFLPDATFVIDQDRKVIAWNRAVEEMTGSKAEDTLGKNNYEYSLPFYGIRRPILIDLVFISDEEIEKKYSFFKKEGDILLAEGNVPLKGESRTLWAKASPLYDSKGNIVGAIESLRDITERKRAEKALKKREKELEVKSRNLEELNTALKVLLKQREVDKDELEERTVSNVKHLVLPYIEKLKKSSLEAKDEAYIGIVESNLKDIVSPFSQRLSSKYMTFTPKELQVANLIKEGRTTKEIAELLNASPGTIDFHRNNIRNKLNLKNKRANLRSYLLTLL